MSRNETRRTGRPGKSSDDIAGSIGGKAASSPITGLAHIAIAVRAADPIVELMVAGLGAARGQEELLYGGDLRIVFVHLGPVTVELLEPRSESHTVAKFLEARGPGLHHVALQVDDIEGALARAKDAGIELIDETPREGAHGTRIAFLHPKSFANVLLELCENRDNRKT